MNTTADASRPAPYPTDTSLSSIEQAHSERLLERIRAQIAGHGGWIGFARYMEMALYEPGLGYYSAGATKLGAGGDFVTAPELSSLFGRCLASQCRDVLTSLGGGDILELGAGSGVMAADILNELETLGALPRRYFILEVSADLRERQRATLATRATRHLERVEWLEALPGSGAGHRGSHPPAIEGVILANEVLDALPVERFRIRANGSGSGSDDSARHGGTGRKGVTAIQALGVVVHDDRLVESERKAGPDLEQAVRSLELELGGPFPDGYTSEVNLRLAPWIGGLAGALQRGAILLMDYGLPRRQYYAPERSEGTLLCHFRHQFNNDPFQNVGLQDIGAWVDFTAVAHGAVDAGLNVAGFATQAHFLMGLGIERYLTEEAGDELVQRISLARQAMLLTLPGEMGERFKAIGLTKAFDEPLRGFSVRDLAASL